MAKVVAELAGKNVTELIAEGRTKVGSVPSGGAAAPAAAAGTTTKFVCEFLGGKNSKLSTYFFCSVFRAFFIMFQAVSWIQLVQNT